MKKAQVKADGLSKEDGRSTKMRRGKRNRKMRCIILAAVILIFVILVLANLAGSGNNVMVANVVSPVRGELQEVVSTSGTVLGEETRVVYAPVGGILAEVYVEAGDAVKAGERMAGYDMEKMERALQQSVLQLKKSTAGYEGVLADNSENHAKLSEAEINLDVLERQISDNQAYLKKLQNQLQASQRETQNGLAASSYEITRRLQELTPGTEEYAQVNSELSRISYLQSIAGSSDYVAKMEQEIADVQERIAGYEEYKAEMESQKRSSESVVMDAYDRTQYDVDRELADMAFAEAEAEYYMAKQGIVAEFDGIVTECAVHPGIAVAEGMQLLTLESSRNLKVTFRASQHDALKLELGQKADVEIAGKIYPGEICKINRMAERNESNTPVIGAEIHLLETDDSIILGLDAKLTIYIKQVEDALLVPVEAVNADRSGDFLYVVQEGIVVRKPIVCGISSDIYTEVLDGIQEEDQIIIGSYAGLEEGMPVTAVPVP